MDHSSGRFALVTALSSALVVASCGSGGAGHCAFNSDCPAGSYCHAGTCQTECTNDAMCVALHGAGAVCSSFGECLVPDGGTAGDAGSMDAGPRPPDAWMPPADAWTMPDAWTPPDAWAPPPDAWAPPPDAWAPPPDMGPCAPRDSGVSPPECAGGRQFRNGVALNVGSTSGFFWTSAGDLDHDCNDDILLHANSGDFVVLRGNGDGTFMAPSTVTTLHGAQQALADIDHDGLVDLGVAAYTGTTPIGVERNLGSGMFGAPASIATTVAGGGLSLAFGDINNDGMQDAVTGSGAWTGTGNGVIVYGVGLGGTSASSTSFDLGYAKIWSIAAADLDHVGGVDVVFDRFWGSGGVTVVLSSGAGLGTPTPYSFGSYPIVVRAGDVNGDGWNDLVAGSWGNGSVSVLLNQQHGTFAAAATTSLSFSGCNASSGCLWDLALPDLNADGRADIVVPGINDNQLAVLMSSSTGTFPSVTETYTVGPSGSAPQAVASGDFNHDGKIDVVVSISNGGAMLFTHCP